MEGKGHSFRFPYPRFNLSSGDTLALKKVTNCKKSWYVYVYTSQNDDNFHNINYLIKIDVLHLWYFKAELYRDNQNYYEL